MNWLRGIAAAALVLTLVSCGGGGSGLAPSIPVPVTNSSYLYITTSSGPVTAYAFDSGGAIHSVAGSPFSVSLVPTVAATVVNGYLYISTPATSEISGFGVDYSTGALTALGSKAPPAVLTSTGPTIQQGCGNDLVGFNETGWFLRTTLKADGTFGSGFGMLDNSISGPRASMALNPSCQLFYFAFPTLNGIYGYSFSFSPNVTNSASLFVSPVPDPGTTPVALAITDDSKFLYVANQGSNNITIYAVDPSTGALAVSGSLVPAGPQPNAIVIAGGFVYVTNAGDGTVSAYSRDATGGALTPVAGSPFAVGTDPIQVISAATSVSVSPTGRLLFVVNQGSNNVSAFKINTGGSLSPLASSPLNANGTPTSVAFAPAPKS